MTRQTTGEKWLAITELVETNTSKVREALATYDRQQREIKNVDSSATLADKIPRKYATANQEYFLIVCMNHGGQILKVIEIHKGGIASTMVDPKCVFRAALRCKNCARIALVHNHPGGDPKPSHDDQLITERLIAASRVLGLQIVDHLILTVTGYSSFRDLGLIS